MIEYVVVCIVALLASGLTLFSGFGLGTLLLPAFLLFFSVDVSIAMTAVVHLLNNLFKLLLVGRHADRRVVVQFGIPAIIAAFGGAGLLLLMSGMQPLATYGIAGQTFMVSLVKLVVGLLIMVFAIMEMSTRFADVQFSPRWLPVGGIVSGFFGGLSGHQGALRSAFLIRAGLSKEAFIGTGVVIACLIDCARLGVYFQRFAVEGIPENASLLGAATLAAFAGAYLGNRLIRKITLRTIQLVVSLMLMLIAAGLVSGIL